MVDLCRKMRVFLIESLEVVCLRVLQKSVGDDVIASQQDGSKSNVEEEAERNKTASAG